MMEVVIVDDGNRLTVYELVERVIPCIIAKHYSENYIQGFRSTFSGPGMPQAAASFTAS